MMLRARGGLTAFAVVYTPADIARMHRLAELAAERAHAWQRAQAAEEAGDDRGYRAAVRDLGRADSSMVSIVRRPMSREREG
jgi:hypothetical protein